MMVSYDAEADAVYIQLADVISAGEVAKTVPSDPREIDGMINLDFDANGRLLGIEVLDARLLLPASLLVPGHWTPQRTS
jgi:uncharacterized protein YuzE